MSLTWRTTKPGREAPDSQAAKEISITGRRAAAMHVAAAASSNLAREKQRWDLFTPLKRVAKVTASARRLLPVSASLLLTLSSLQAAEPANKPQVSTITVTGESVVMVEPDRAEIDIGVVSEARTALEAGTENAAKLSEIIAEVKKSLMGRGGVKTIGYSVDPLYRYPRQSGKAQITGYRATNIVRVTTDDLKGVGKLIDAATGSGANQIHRLVFTLRDDQDTQELALRQATRKAKAKAQAIADALGLKIARVFSVTQNDRIPRPLMVEARAGVAPSAAAPTPVEPGIIEVRASVTLTAELLQP